MSGALLALPFGLAIGLLLGSVGAGGSLLAVPVLVYVLGEPVKTATTESLLVVGVAALAGAARDVRTGRVQLETALAFGAAGAAGSVGGTALNRFVGGRALLLGFAVLLLAAAAAMMRRRPAPSSGGTHSLPHVAPVGLATGLLTGFFGVGGGFVIVPALVLLLGLPISRAVGTSLVVIALTSTAALAAHLASGSIDWPIASILTGAAIAGALAGRRFGSSLRAERLGQAFALLLVAVALLLVVENAAAVV